MSFDISALIDYLNSNPEAKTSLLAALQPTKPVRAAPTKDFPAPSKIMLMQSTFFDNGPKGVRRPKTAEYAICIEAWTDLENLRLSEWDWKRNIVLIPLKDFTKRVKDLAKKGTISEEYAGTLNAVVADCPHEPAMTYFGLIGDKGTRDGANGTFYYDHQFVMARIENRVVTQMHVFAHDDVIGQVRFEPTDMKGNPLRGSARRQSRLDPTSGFNSNWATE